MAQREGTTEGGFGAKQQPVEERMERPQMVRAKRSPSKRGIWRTAAQYYCIRCAREFLALKSSGARLAVYAGAISFYQLSNEVADRWLEERCPGARSTQDNEDRKRRIGEIPVSSDRVDDAAGPCHRSRG